MDNVCIGLYAKDVCFFIIHFIGDSIMNAHVFLRLVQLPYGFYKAHLALPMLLLLMNNVLSAEVKTSDNTGLPAAPLERIASLGGISRWVEKGKYLYISQGDALLIFDQTDRDQPKRLNWIPLSGQARKLTILDKEMHVFAEQYGSGGCALYSFDISDPIHPKEREYKADEVDFDATHDELSNDVDNTPTSETIKRLEGPLQNASRVLVDGTRAWVLDEHNGWLMVNVADSSNPKIIGSVGLPEGDSPYGLLGTWVFGGGDKPGLRVYNADKPGTCTVQATVPLKEPLKYLSISGKTAFVAAGKAGLVTVDIANPANPRILATYATAQPCIMTIARQNLAVIQTDDLLLLDVTDPAHPNPKSKLGVGDTMTTDTAVVDQPLAPRCSLGGWALDGQSLVLRWEEEHVGKELQFFDVSNPSDPVLVKCVDGDQYDQYKMLMARDGFLVAHRYSWNSQLNLDYLQIYDLHNPAKPRDLGSYECLSEVADFVMQRNIIYVADGRNGLVILRLKKGSK